jgi:O-antigen/teichoic acid export membrane protein
MSEAVSFSPRRVALNTTALFASYGLNSVLALLVSIAIIRHLGRSEYGVMAFVVSYLSFFQILASLGIDTVLIREAARRPAEASDLVSGALSLRLLLSVSTMLLAWLIIPLVGDDPRATWLVMLYSGTFLFSSSALYLIRFNIDLRSHVPTLILAVWSILYTVGRLTMVALGARVWHFLAADVGSAAVVLLISRWVGRRYSGFRPRFRVDVRLWGFLLREAWPIALAGWLIALHTRADQTLLFRLRGSEELGGYAVAVRMAEVWGIITNVFLVSLFPILSRYALDATDRFQRTSQLAYRYLYVAICPIALAIWSYAADLLGLLLGEQYADAAPALAVLGLAEVFVFMNAVSYNILFSMGRQREAAVMAGVSLMVNLVLNVVFIPRRGALGAALASLLSYGLIPLLGLISSAARPVSRDALSCLARPLLATVATGLVLWTLSPGLAGGLLLILVLYPVAILFSGSLGPSDWKLLRRAASGA